MQTAPSTTAPAGHVVGLDGLRAVAAVAVVAYHVQFLARSGTDPLSAAGAAGWVGVDLFFAISGFILFLPFARASRDGRTIDVRRFYSRRGRRILPGFWFNLVVLVTLVSPVLLTTGRGLATILTNATFTADYVGLPSVNSVYWSLYCEMAFYLVLPFLAHAFVGRRWVLGLPAAMAVGWLYRFVVVSTVDDVDSYFGLLMQLPGVIDQFAFGMAAAAVWALVELRPGAVPRWATGGATAAGLLVVGVVAWSVQRGIGLARFWSGDHEWGAVALAGLRPCLSLGFALVIFGVCFRDSPVRRALELRPVRYLGVVSYGLYLWHLPVIRALDDVLDLEGRSTVAYLSSVAAVLALGTLWAAISYHLVETRFLRPGARPAPPVAGRGAGPGTGTGAGATSAAAGARAPSSVPAAP